MNLNAPTADPLQLLTVADVAALMRMSERWVEARYSDGTLRHLKLGKAVRFRRSAVEALQSTFDPDAESQLAQVIEMRRAS
jgi:excisionase family DNA binding protein